MCCLIDKTKKKIIIEQTFFFLFFCCYAKSRRIKTMTIDVKCNINALKKTEISVQMILIEHLLKDVS